MGGGCSLLSIQYSSKISAVFNFAAAETNPSAIDASSGIAIPALLYAGDKDCVTPPSSNQLPMYNNIQNVCKTYVLINKARHCQWADNNATCRAGEFFCSPLSASPKQTLAVTYSLLQPWLNDKLNGYKVAATNFQTLLTTGSGFTYQQNCTAIANAAETDNTNMLKVYPSKVAVGSIVNISIPPLKNKSLLQVFNQSGRQVYTKKITQSNIQQQQQISTANLQKGIYFIVLSDGNTRYKNTFVID